jgi:hypothetical protein
MATMNINFDWTRGPGKPAYKILKGKICQIENGRDLDRPLERAEALYLLFANLDPSPASCLSFAQNWGLLWTPARRGASESLEDWRREIGDMKAWLRRDREHFRVAGKIHAKITSIDVALEYDVPDTKPSLKLQPTTLLGAMLLQFAQSMTSGKTQSTCAYCGNWFEVGTKAKRRMAKFCSDPHRNRYHYEQRMGS